MKRAVFIGRYSPFHEGHLTIMMEKVKQKVPLLILVRDTKHDQYPATLRKKMIEATMEKLGADAVVQIIPDIESVNYGRGVGYEINEIEVTEDIKNISATKIRELIDEKDKSWKEMMPEGADDVLENRLEQRGAVVWLTGLPCSGKSTIGKALEKELHKKGMLTILLDGDVVREGLNSDLGFSPKDREENIRRIGEVAKLFSNAGVFVIVCFISPYQKDRDRARKLIGEDFKEIFLKCSLEKCEERDVKGMYKKAREGKIKEFTGVSAPYEEPKKPELVLNTEKRDVEHCVNKILEIMNL